MLPNRLTCFGVQANDELTSQRLVLSKNPVAEAYEGRVTDSKFTRPKNGWSFVGPLIDDTRLTGLTVEVLTPKKFPARSLSRNIAYPEDANAREQEQVADSKVTFGFHISILVQRIAL